MGHLQNFETELRAFAKRLKFGDEEAFETLVQWVKGQVLQSYRNGLKAKAHPEGVRRDAAKDRSN
jgi:hypothetical protein